MPWTKWKDHFSRVQGSADYYLGSYVRATGARLTPIAKAIYEKQTVKDIREGLSVLNHLPEFFKISRETSALIKMSAITNFGLYLVPIILYSRFFTEVLPKSTVYNFAPEIKNFYIDWALWSLKMTVILVSFYANQAKSNFVVYVPSYARTIANDINEYLPILLANELTKEYGAVFDDMFRMKGNYEKLNSKLEKKFRKFFSKPIVSKKSLFPLKDDLSMLFAKILNEQPTGRFDDFNNHLSQQLANEIVAELASVFEKDKDSEKKSNRDSLQEMLSKPFDSKTAKFFAAEFRRRMADIRAKVQSYLPVDYYPSCDCKKTKTKIRYLVRTSSAVVSNPFYYLFNIILTQMTELSWSYVVTRDVFFWLSLFFTMVRMLNAGLSLASMKITQSSHCKAHLDQILMGNKAYGLGVGALQIIIVEALAWFIHLTMGVRNFFTNDAINQFVSQIFAIAMLTKKGLLPGKKLDAWNVFFIPKELFRLCVRYVTWLFGPNPEKTQENLLFWNNLKYYLTSDALYKIVKFILKPKSFIIRNNHALIRPQENILDVLFDDKEICQLLTRYREDIQSFLDWIIPFQEKIQTLNNISQKLLAIKNSISSYLDNKYFAFYLTMIEQFISYFIDLSSYQQKADVLANLLLPMLADESLKILFNTIQAKLYNMDTQARRASIKKVEEEFEAKIIPPVEKIKEVEVKKEVEVIKEEIIKIEAPKKISEVLNPLVDENKLEEKPIVPDPKPVIRVSLEAGIEKAYFTERDHAKTLLANSKDKKIEKDETENNQMMFSVVEPESPVRQYHQIKKRAEPTVTDTLVNCGMWGAARFIKQAKRTVHDVKYALKNKATPSTNQPVKQNGFELQTVRKVSSQLR